MILSVAQFRPEKEHSTQLRALKAFIQQKKIPHTASVKLVMAGSVRNAGDEKRIAELRTLAKELGVAVSDLSSQGTTFITFLLSFAGSSGFCHQSAVP